MTPADVYSGAIWEAGAVVVDVQEVFDPWAPEETRGNGESRRSSWLVHARYAGRRYTLLIGGDGLPLHCDGLNDRRAPAQVELAAYRMLFAERAPALLAALDRPKLGHDGQAN